MRDIRTEYQQMRQADARSIAVDIRRDRAEVCIKALRIPNRFRSKTLADFIAKTKPQQAVKQAVADYLKNWPFNRANGTNLIFIGDVGTGKSMLAWIMCQALAKQGFTTRCITEGRLMEEWRDTFTDPACDERSWFQRYIELDFLAIDELSVFAGKNENRLNTMFRILNCRYDDERPTLLSSNLTTDELRDHLGERMYDRIEERCKPLVMAWESYRKRKQ